MAEEEKNKKTRQRPRTDPEVAAARRIEQERQKIELKFDLARGDKLNVVATKKHSKNPEEIVYYLSIFCSNRMGTTPTYDLDNKIHTPIMIRIMDPEGGLVLPKTKTAPENVQPAEKKDTLTLFTNKEGTVEPMPLVFCDKPGIKTIQIHGQGPELLGELRLPGPPKKRTPEMPDHIKHADWKTKMGWLLWNDNNYRAKVAFAAIGIAFLILIAISIAHLTSDAESIPATQDPELGRLYRSRGFTDATAPRILKDIDQPQSHLLAWVWILWVITFISAIIYLIVSWREEIADKIESLSQKGLSKHKLKIDAKDPHLTVTGASTTSVQEGKRPFTLKEFLLYGLSIDSIQLFLAWLFGRGRF